MEATPVLCCWASSDLHPTGGLKPPVEKPNGGNHDVSVYRVLNISTYVLWN